MNIFRRNRLEKKVAREGLLFKILRNYNTFKRNPAYALFAKKSDLTEEQLKKRRSYKNKGTAGFATLALLAELGISSVGIRNKEYLGVQEKGIQGDIEASLLANYGLARFAFFSAGSYFTPLTRKKSAEMLESTFVDLERVHSKEGVVETGVGIRRKGNNYEVVEIKNSEKLSKLIYNWNESKIKLINHIVPDSSNEISIDQVFVPSLASIIKFSLDGKPIAWYVNHLNEGAVLPLEQCARFALQLPIIEAGGYYGAGPEGKEFLVSNGFRFNKITLKDFPSYQLGYNNAVLNDTNRQEVENTLLKLGYSKGKIDRIIKIKYDLNARESLINFLEKGKNEVFLTKILNGLKNEKALEESFKIIDRGLSIELSKKTSAELEQIANTPVKIFYFDNSTRKIFNSRLNDLYKGIVDKDSKGSDESYLRFYNSVVTLAEELKGKSQRIQMPTRDVGLKCKLENSVVILPPYKIIPSLQIGENTGVIGYKTLIPSNNFLNNSAVTIDGSNSYIYGLSIEGMKDDDKDVIVYNNFRNISVQNCLITKGLCGVFYEGVNGGTINRNEIYYSSQGITIINSLGLDVQENRIYAGEASYVIKNSRVNIKNNTTLGNNRVIDIF